MRGINGKPFVVMDKFFDIEGLDSIRDDIIFGLARAKDRHWGAYGPNVLERDKYLDVGEVERNIISKLPDWHEDKIRYDSLQNSEDKRTWIKLKYGAYSGYHTVVLRTSKDYSKRNDASACAWLDDVQYFGSLINWIYGQSAFQSIGRVVFFVTEHDAVSVEHNHEVPGKHHQYEFAWFQFNGKSFYVKDRNGHKHYIYKRSAFFNDVDVHGGDPSPRMTFSLRIDGAFSPEVREAIGSDPINPLY